MDVLLFRVKMGTGANREKQEKREKADTNGRKRCEKKNWAPELKNKFGKMVISRLRAINWFETFNSPVII